MQVPAYVHTTLSETPTVGGCHGSCIGTFCTTDCGLRLLWIHSFKSDTVASSEDQCGCEIEQLNTVRVLKGENLRLYCRR